MQIVISHAWVFMCSIMMHKKIECSYSQQQKICQMFVNIWKIVTIKVLRERVRIFVRAVKFHQYFCSKALYWIWRLTNFGIGKYKSFRKDRFNSYSSIISIKNSKKDKKQIKNQWVFKDEINLLIWNAANDFVLFTKRIDEPFASCYLHGYSFKISILCLVITFCFPRHPYQFLCKVTVNLMLILVFAKIFISLE